MYRGDGHAAGQPHDEGPAILAAARALAGMIREAAPEIEAGRDLPPRIVAALGQAGVYRMSFPRSWGGPELTPAQQFEVIEALSEADGSTGWCAYVGSNGGYFTAYLDQDVARSLYPTVESLDSSSGGVPTPLGAAEPVEGGYRLNGHWFFGSGIRHSRWFIAGAVVRKEGKVVLDEAGKPRVIAAFVPTEQIEVLANWNATGLKGTGSHDFRISDLVVPAEHTFNFYTSPVQRTEALYAFPNLFFFNHAAVVLGIARAAIGEFRALCQQKRTPWGMLGDQDFARTALARAEALVLSGRQFALSTLHDIQARLEEDGALTLEQAGRFRLAITHSHEAAVEAVNLVFHAAGTSAVKVPSLLDRCFRDVHTANQHLVTSPMSHVIVGGMLLGEVPSDPLYFPPPRD